MRDLNVLRKFYVADSGCRWQLIFASQTRQARESGRARPGLESAPCATPRPYPVAAGPGQGLSGGAGAQRAFRPYWGITDPSRPVWCT
jgi:hypothetical protein